MWELIKTLILGDYVILRRVEYDNLVIQLDRQRRQDRAGAAGADAVARGSYSGQPQQRETATTERRHNHEQKTAPCESGAHVRDQDK